MIIIGSTVEMKVGERRTGIYNEKWYPDMPYIVIKQATREEWIAENKDAEKFLSLKEVQQPIFFYQIAID